MARVLWRGAAEQLYVNESGWWRDGGAFNASIAPIQAAVDAAGEGEAIYVWNGSYTENVDVDKRLTLVGEGVGVVTVTAADPGNHVFNVITDWVNLSGFTVTGAVKGAIGDETSGICLDDADYCNISGNDAYGNRRGIYLHSSSNNMLANSTVSDNKVGILLMFSSSNMLTKNTANSNNWNGILLDSFSNNNTLHSNNASNNPSGIFLRYSSNNTLTNNTANSNKYEGIYLRSSSNNTLTNNNVSNNEDGIFMCWFTSSNNLTSNVVNSNSEHGIYLSWCSSSNTLNSNMMSGNTYNFGVRGKYLSHYTQSIDTSNMVDEKPIYYWVDEHDKTIPDDAGFIGVVNSTNIMVRDLMLTNNKQGVLFAYVENSRVENVDTSNTYDGIYLYFSSNNTLTDNEASNSDRAAIHLLSQQLNS